MARNDRRDKLALDEAYRLFKQLDKEETTPNIFQLVRCLKTVNYAIASSENGHFKLTKRLWQRIQFSLFDRLFTAFPVYVVVMRADGSVLDAKSVIPETATIEIHPEGLRRNDDGFSLAFEDLHPNTRGAFLKVWHERGNNTRPQDFANYQCEDYCVPKMFVIGDEVLTSESTAGKEKAHQKWWELYWQAYCADAKDSRQTILNQMQALELVWGDLYY